MVQVRTATLLFRLLQTSKSSSARSLKCMFSRQRCPAAPPLCAQLGTTQVLHFASPPPRLEAHLLDDSWQTSQADNVRQITVGNSTDALVRVAPRHWRTCHVRPQFPRPHENSMQWSIGADDALSSSATRRGLATSADGLCSIARPPLTARCAGGIM